METPNISLEEAEKKLEQAYESFKSSSDELILYYENIELKKDEELTELEKLFKNNYSKHLECEKICNVVYELRYGEGSEIEKNKQEQKKREEEEIEEENRKEFLKESKKWFGFHFLNTNCFTIIPTIDFLHRKNSYSEYSHLNFTFLTRSFVIELRFLGNNGYNKYNYYS